MKKLTLILALILVLALPGLAGAWTFTQEFRNDYADADAIYLWMETPGVTFGTTDLRGGHSDWDLAVNQPTQQFMYGPAKPANTAGIFVTVNAFQSQAFSFQWAEVNWSGDEYSILGSGTAIWSGIGWGGSSNFSPEHRNDIVHLPIPPSALLLGTGILGLGLLGLKSRKMGHLD